MKSEYQPVDPNRDTYPEEFETLQAIVDQLQLAGYTNNQGKLVNHVVFKRLQQLAARETSIKRSDESNLYNDDLESITNNPQEAFHIEADIYDSGDYSNLLVMPSNDAFIIVSGNEHLCTIAKTCDAPEYWEQREGSLEDDVVENIGREVSNYISSFNA